VIINELDSISIKHPTTALCLTFRIIATRARATFGNFMQFSVHHLHERAPIITRSLYTFPPLFEVHLCTVTFGLMYVLGSYNTLLIIVIICTVNVPQIKQTNKLKAQISPAVQTIG
jgi:hypothetical protein